ncbi:MAG: diguanylate cyclase [Ruminococcaceae bacterium]|nr:diguanylate cyclase [Oscillospiraceae bacterium]
MSKMVEKYKALVKRMKLLYGSKKMLDEKEKSYLEYVKLQRICVNLRYSILFAIFLSIAVLFIIIFPQIREYFDFKLFFIWFIALAALVLYIIVGKIFYERVKSEDKSKKDLILAEGIHGIFWCIYPVALIAIAHIFSNPLQSVIIWIAFFYIGVQIPIYSFYETFFIYPITIIAAVVFLVFADLSLELVIACVPVVVFMVIVAQATHLDRLEAYYLIAKNSSENFEAKRRAANIFSQVFDVALEVNLHSGLCEILRENEFLGITENTEMQRVEEIIDFVKEYAHPDDKYAFEKNLNTDYITDEFLAGRTQLYFEGRVLTKNNEYVWFSFLISREEEVGSEYCLCLVQNINERKQQEGKLRFEAERDPLTQLYNKVTTKSLIEECLEKSPSAQHALVVIDIDNFKTINDSRGHALGDKILLAFANELNKNFRETDIIGRVGGDEFIVLIRNVQSIAMVCDKLQQLTSNFKRYGVENGLPGRLSTSIGVSLFNKDGKNYDELFKKADAALYEAKRNGKDQYKFSITRA